MVESSLLPDAPRDSITAAVCGQIADLVEGLGQIYTPEGVCIWLTGRHQLLDNRSPLDVMREDGGIDRVEQVFAMIRDGAYA